MLFNKNTYDFIIIGAGIIGLNISFSLKKQFPESDILIIEKQKRKSQRMNKQLTIIIPTHNRINGDGTILFKIYSKNNDLYKNISLFYKKMKDYHGRILLRISEITRIAV
jgi:hypothetical protein